MLNEQKEGADFETLASDNDVSKAFRKQLYENKNYQKIVKEYIVYWDSLGLLDPLSN